MTQRSPNILYSFRRCPYAMRARLALNVSIQTYELREVVLRDKPAAMIALSPKATVPVLQLTEGTVLEESLEIMLWALEKSDPEGWLSPQTGTLEQMLALIAVIDGDFKHHLDRYKYAARYEGADSEHHRAKAEEVLAQLEQRLSASVYLFGSRPALADLAIAPFVRQFANADRNWFDTAPYPNVRNWVNEFQGSARFLAAMDKHPQWHPGAEAVIYPHDRDA